MQKYLNQLIQADQLATFDYIIYLVNTNLPISQHFIIISWCFCVSVHPDQFPVHQNKLIDIFFIRNGFGHALSLQTSVCPTNEFWIVQLEIAYFLITREPFIKGNQSNINKPKCLTPKIWLVAKHLLQLLHILY